MARETRLPKANDSSKRKRKSPSPPSTTPTTIKLVPPSPANTEKKQRISLKVSASPDKVALSEVESDGDAIANGETSEMKKRMSKPLTTETRDALALVIAQMSLHLPAPLNNILTLWLPPDFAQKEENTLSYVLKQDTLTWDELVETLHLFSENLLVPCAYPNPMPSLTKFHNPTPPLPSHLPPHVIYNFCASLHSLMAHIAPPNITPVGLDSSSEEKEEKPERWGLMQKTPSQGTVGGEWFTGPVDLREVGIVKKELGDDKSLLETMAESGDKFGYASAIAIEPGHVVGSSSKPKIPTLNDSLIKKASLKMAKWKEQREARRYQGFGSILKGVKDSSAIGTFTPSFAPCYDSTISSGLGFWETTGAMHERHRYREYSHRVWGRAIKNDESGWSGCIEPSSAEGDAAGDIEVVGAGGKKNKGKGRDLEDVLADNESLIEELQSWQYLRLRRGSESWISEREKVVAEELLSSLTRLTSHITPADLLPSSSTSKIGLAHTIAARFIPTSSPIIRGTLDPRRPQALHDNLTIKIRPTPLLPPPANGAPQSGMSTSRTITGGTTPSTGSYQYNSSTSYSRTTYAPSNNAPRTPQYPPNGSYRSQAAGSPLPPPGGYTYSTSASQPYRNQISTPSAAGIYSRNTGVVGPSVSGPGPSGLRQTYATPAYPSRT